MGKGNRLQRGKKYFQSLTWIRFFFLTRKRATQIEKWAKCINRQLTEEKTQKTNQGVYKGSNSLVIGGRHISASYHSTTSLVKIQVWFSQMKYRTYASRNNSIPRCRRKEIMGPCGSKHEDIHCNGVYGMGAGGGLGVHSRAANGRHRGHTPRTPCSPQEPRTKCAHGEGEPDQ